jgi:hypothetical protein
VLWITGDTVLYDGVRQVADRLQVDTALLHLGCVRFAVTGPVRYTMTAKDAVALCRLVRPQTAIPIHYEGWTHFRQGGEPAQTAVVVYGAVFLLLGLPLVAMFAWVTRDDRLLGRLPSPEVVRAARLRSMVGSVAYSLAIALAFVSPLLALALHGATALYYTFDQASVPTERAPADRRPAGPACPARSRTVSPNSPPNGST